MNSSVVWEPVRECNLRWELCFWRRELRRGVMSVIVGLEFEPLGGVRVV